MAKSRFGKLDRRDVIRGLLLAIATPVASGLVLSMQYGALPGTEDFKVLVIIGISAGLSYLLKNVLTNSDDKLLKTEKE